MASTMVIQQSPCPLPTFKAVWIDFSAKNNSVSFEGDEIHLNGNLSQLDTFKAIVTFKNQVQIYFSHSLQDSLSVLTSKTHPETFYLRYQYPSLIPMLF